MKKIALFDTSQATLNMGDYIINNSINRELSELLKDNFVCHFPTHVPLMHWYQRFFNYGVYSYTKAADYKFICGTNILKKNMFLPAPDWNVNIFNYKPYQNSILVGCGMDGDFQTINFYTKILYKKILSKDFIHSTRDERTKLFLESLGFKAINTGCATLWSLTEEKCKKIPTKKSKNVVFTLTDYCKDMVKDQQLIDCLSKNYENVFFWVQGSEDFNYLKQLNNIDNIQIIYGLDAFEELLQTKPIDYIGTRLHAGIFAMQNEVRTIIIAVDNRTRDMQKNYNLNVVERKDIQKLEKKINSEFHTNINLDIEKIEQFKNQFK